MVEKKALLANPKHQHRVSQWGKHDCSAHNGNGLLWVSKFDSFHGWTLNIRKMAEKRAFHFAYPKHQYHVSQCGEQDYFTHKERMKIITSIQVCLISQMNINLRKMVERKSISCKSKASRSCITMWRTWL